MVKKAHWQTRISTFNTDDPRGLGALVISFLEWWTVRGYSIRTIDRYVYSLRNFVEWCSLRGISRPEDVTKPVLERYQRYLFYYRKASGNPLNHRSQYTYVSVVQAFFRFLAKQNYILSNPASDLELPRYGKPLPRDILSVSEMERVLNSVDLANPLGVRDRAILETFYSTGIRRTELIRLKVFDLNMDRETVMIREGKWKKDRLIPIGNRALAWIRKYLDEVRPSLVTEPDEKALFLTNLGEELGPENLSRLAKRYIDAANVSKKGSCHIFRHTMATHMLEGGADIRFIQQMLGHESLDTTSIYTRVSIRKLQEIYQATHQGAKLERKEPDKKALEQTETVRGGLPLTAEEELFSSLAAEGKEEENEKESGSARTGSPGR